ncbi:20596_t:CDS:10 [Entrophospora sp. SA101]|nr:20596_t:CDS:10 [Entrophospora sp. SA101]
MIENELIESLTVHSYDPDVYEKYRRKFTMTKLVDLIELNLKNTNDYLQAIKTFIGLPEIQVYLYNNVIFIPADFPGQLYICRAIVKKLKNENETSIPEKITHLLIYFQENKSWNLLEFLQWSIVYANDFNEKQDEHLLYKICLEKLSINPQLIETNDSNESIIIRQLALQCLETFEKESKLFNVKAFWKNSSTVMKTLGKASDMNSKNIIHQMLDIHYDFTLKQKSDSYPSESRKKKDTINIKDPESLNDVNITNLEEVIIHEKEVIAGQLTNENNPELSLIKPDLEFNKQMMRDAYIKIHQDLCDLSSQKDWFIESYSVSDAFHKYQINNIDKLEGGEAFHFSSDVEAILSLHHIMFIDMTRMKKPLYLDIDERKWRASEINDIDELRSKFYDIWGKYRDKVIYLDNERSVARAFYERMHLYPSLRQKNEDTVVHDYVHDTFKEIFRDSNYDISWANTESLTSRSHCANYGCSQGRKPDIIV